jgi:hypothetical protein
MRGYGEKQKGPAKKQAPDDKNTMRCVDPPHD